MTLNPSPGHGVIFRQSRRPLLGGMWIAGAADVVLMAGVVTAGALAHSAEGTAQTIPTQSSPARTNPPASDIAGVEIAGTDIASPLTPRAIVVRGKAAVSVVPPSCAAVRANPRAGQTLVCALRIKDIPRLPLPSERYAFGEVVHRPGEVPSAQYAEDRTVGSCGVQRGRSCAGTVSLVGGEAPWIFRALGHMLAPNAIPGPTPRAETGNVLVTLPNQGRSRGIALGPDPSPGKP